jgi:NAD+ diphosphatase
MRALHWLNWDRQSQFCGRCGSALEGKMDATEKKCPTCETSIFPRFSPAVMVLIRKGDKILLARSPHFESGFYSAIAGFIDVGETAEQAAHREVKEELGLEISDLEYFSTQTWPFPDSFMIAFKAQYRGGDLKLDEIEIEDARWFGQHDLPMLPPHASIARHLIDSVLAEMA